MSTYEIYYFDLPGRAEAAKMVLLSAGVAYESKAIKGEEWPQAQKDTPFGVLPYMVEHQEVGTKFVLGESHAIERYLARKYGLLGKDNQEMAFLESICENGSFMSDKFFGTLQLEGEAKIKATKQFEEEVAPKFIKYHEALLGRNENRTYLGGEFTLAEFFNCQVIRVINLITGKNIFSKSKTPNLWKMYENVRQHQTFVAYFEETDVKLKKHCEQFFSSK